MSLRFVFPLCAFAFLGTSVLDCFSGEEDLKVGALVDALASSNAPPKRTHVEGDFYKFTYPADYDRAEQRRVEKAWDALLEKGTAVFPLLIEHLDDHRYSFTDNALNRSVGDACFDIVLTQVEVYHNVMGGDRRFDPEFLGTTEAMIAWWKNNRTKSLRDMQLEAVQWALAEEQKKGGGIPTTRVERTMALQRLITRMGTMNRPIRVDRQGKLLGDDKDLNFRAQTQDAN